MLKNSFSRRIYTVLLLNEPEEYRLALGLIPQNVTILTEVGPPVDLNLMNIYIGDMQEVLMAGSLAERRAFIRSFVEEIKVKGTEAVLTYFPPISPEMVELEERTVPRTVQRGGQ